MKTYRNNPRNNQKTFELNNTIQSQLAFSLDKNSPALQQAASKSKIIGSIIISTVCLSIFSYVTYNAYRYNTIPENLDNTPLIKRDIAPLRIIPADIEGEQFSNQDKLIYNNFEDQKVNDWKKKVIREDKKQNADNPVLEAASKEILDTSTKANQTEFSDKKLPTDNKTDNKQKQTKVTETQKQTEPKRKEKKPSASSVFDVLD